VLLKLLVVQVEQPAAQAARPRLPQVQEPEHLLLAALRALQVALLLVRPVRLVRRVSTLGRRQAVQARRSISPM
jgi:hypothetical protein